jgi:hypothetical protein
MGVRGRDVSIGGGGGAELEIVTQMPGSDGEEWGGSMWGPFMGGR